MWVEILHKVIDYIENHLMDEIKNEDVENRTKN